MQYSHLYFYIVPKYILEHKKNNDKAKIKKIK